MKTLPQRKHLKRIPVWLPNDQPTHYFVTQCCFERKELFTDPKNVRFALDAMIDMTERLQWKIYYACFMTDHVHWVLSPQENREQSLSKLMQRWKSSTTQKIAKNIWQDEFFDHLLRSDESLSEKWQYIMMNPVRAGFTEKPDDYPFVGSVEEIYKKNNWK